MNKKAIITSALPYANGEIHLGHVASTYLPADVTARFLKLNGVEAYYVCASDDFGTPILIQSEKEGKTPAEYVAHWNKRDYEDFSAFTVVTRRGETRNLAANRSECFSLWREMYFLGQKGLEPRNCCLMNCRLYPLHHQTVHNVWRFKLEAMFSTG